MSTKRQMINKIINDFIRYGKQEKFPFFDSSVKIVQFRQEYTADHIAGLTMKYLIPAYEEGLDTLRGYLKLEGDRLRMLGAMKGVDESLLKFQLSTDQENYVLKCIVEIIDVINQ